MWGIDITCGGILYINASCFRRSVLSGSPSLTETGAGCEEVEEVKGWGGVVLNGLAILHLQL